MPHHVNMANVSPLAGGVFVAPGVSALSVKHVRAPRRLCLSDHAQLVHWASTRRFEENSKFKQGHVDPKCLPDVTASHGRQISNSGQLVPCTPLPPSQPRSGFSIRTGDTLLSHVTKLPNLCRLAVFHRGCLPEVPSGIIASIPWMKIFRRVFHATS